MQLNDPATHNSSSGRARVQEEHGRAVKPACWQRLHLTEVRRLQLRALRAERPYSTGERDLQVNWCVGPGDLQADLVQAAPGSIRRFCYEHGSRFQKQAFFRLCPPE